jgi:hypothetical protein
MQLRDLSKPITSKTLNERLAKKFGYKLNLEQFSDVQLEDVRNRLRTEVSQFEVSESFDSMNSNPKYQKTKALLDVINQEILEREEGMYEGAKPDFLDMDKDGNKKESMKKAIKDKKMKKESADIYKARLSQKAQEYAVPASWIKSAINRVSLGESFDQEELVAELTTRYDLKESVAEHIVYLSEGEEDKAKVIMATKDMVEQITGWLEDTAQLKAEQLLELLDSIRENFGSDVASKYEQSVKPALEGIYTALESSRQGLQSGLALVSGGEAPTMGAPTPDMGGAPTPDMAGGEAPMGTEPGAEAAPDMAAEPDRMKRESVDYSRRLGMLLASKKK